jgi:hypothetical protein
MPLANSTYSELSVLKYGIVNLHLLAGATNTESLLTSMIITDY